MSLCSSVYIVTGGTRGIGFGLARELLKRGQKVFICGRSKDSVNAAITKLIQEVNDSGNSFTDSDHHIGGEKCDISTLSDVQNLWDMAVAKFGRVDVFVNNAAISPGTSLDDIDENLLSQTIDANIKGAMFCVKVAKRGFDSFSQKKPCRIYLMEGLGSDGRIRSATSSIYGLTKYAGTYLANFVEGELASDPDTCVKLGRLSPGMVTTDLLIGSFPKDPVQLAKTRKIMNILADKETTVTPWLAERLIAGDLVIRWLTGMGVAGRFIKSLFVSRDLFTEEQPQEKQQK